MVHGASATAAELGAVVKEVSEVANATGRKTIQGIDSLSAAAQKGIFGANAFVTDEEVAAPTPKDRWFMPRLGWPHASAGQGPAAPPLLMPVDAALAPNENEVIGYLEVEILEADQLPHTDLGVYGTDPYALIVFEGFAIRTNHIDRTTHPRWSATNSWRAIRLPVLKAYSDLYVSIVDDDDNVGLKHSTLGNIDHDDSVGRVLIEIGTLVSGTTYDAWYQLSYNPIEPPTGSRGSVRLRYTLHMKSERSRLLSYLSPLTRPGTRAHSNPPKHNHGTHFLRTAVRWPDT